MICRIHGITFVDTGDGERFPNYCPRNFRSLKRLQADLLSVDFTRTIELDSAFSEMLSGRLVGVECDESETLLSWAASEEFYELRTRKLQGRIVN